MRLFNPANFDFSLVLDYGGRKIAPGAMMLSAECRYAWEIVNNKENRVEMRIGDRAGWKWQMVGPLMPPSIKRVAVTRTGKHMRLIVNDEAVLIVVGDIFIPGNTIDFPSRIKLPTDRLNQPDDFFCTVANNWGDVQPIDKDILIFTIVYGDLYTDLLQDVAFPSLYQHNIARDFPKNKKIINRVYCPKSTADKLREYAAKLQSLGIPTEFRTERFDNAESDDFVSVRYKCVIDCIWEANRNNEIVVMLPPDHFIGYGVYDCIKRMVPGDYYVFCHPRVSLRSHQALKSRLAKDDCEFKSNSDIVRFAFEEYPHVMVRTGLTEKPLYWWATDEGDHYAVRFKEPPPFLFDPCLDIVNILEGPSTTMLGDQDRFRFAMIDHDVVDYLMHLNRIKFPDTSKLFFCAELTDDKTYNPTIYNTYQEPCAKFFGATPILMYK